MASRSDNTAIQNLRARHRAQLAAIKAYERRSTEVHAARQHLDQAREALDAAEQRQQLALATIAALVGDAKLAAVTVDVPPTTVSRARKAVDAADIRAEVEQLLSKELGHGQAANP